MTDLPLLDYVPRARKSDPETSHLAAEKAQKSATKQGKLILGYLQDIYPHAATPDQIGRAIGLDHVQVDRLRAPLVRENRVVIVGKGRMANGNEAGLWKLAPSPVERAA